MLPWKMETNIFESQQIFTVAQSFERNIFLVKAQFLATFYLAIRAPVSSQIKPQGVSKCIHFSQ